MPCRQLLIAAAIPLLLWLGATGCQSYSPRPLDIDAHAAAWEARSSDTAGLREFIVGLDADGVATPFDAADGLDLAEGERLALVFNRELRVARARAGVALAGAEHAGLWDDPEFQLDVLKIVESIPNPWLIATALSFTLPISGRLDIEKSVANAAHRMALHDVAAQEWATLTSLRSTWLEWSATRMRAAVADETLARIDVVVDLTGRLEAAGEMSRIEHRLFRLERAAREADRLRLDAAADGLELRLRALMGLTPAAPIALQPTLVVPPVPAEAARREQLVSASPALAVRRAEYDFAEEALRLEIQEQYPDLEFGPAFERETGESKVGFVSGIPVPILNANRRAIAEAEAQRETSRAAFEGEYERVVAELRDAEVEYAAATAVRRTVEDTLVPLAEEQIADQERLIGIGQLNVILALDTVIRGQETRDRLIEARLAEARSATRILSVLGPAVHPVDDAQEAPLP